MTCVDFYVHFVTRRALIIPCRCALQRRFDDNVLAQHTSGAEAERTAAELRGLLKLKSLECERYAMAATEHSAAVARLTAECSGLREKVAVLQVRG